MKDIDTKSLEFLTEAVEGNVAIVYHGDDMEPERFLAAINGFEYRNTSKLYQDGLYCVRDPFHAASNDYGKFLYKIMVRNMRDFFHFDPTTFIAVYPDKAKYTELESEEVEKEEDEPDIPKSMEPTVYSMARYVIQRAFSQFIEGDEETGRRLRGINSVIGLRNFLMILYEKHGKDPDFTAACKRFFDIVNKDATSKDPTNVAIQWVLSKALYSMMAGLAPGLGAGDVAGEKYPDQIQRNGKFYTKYSKDEHAANLDGAAYGSDHSASIPVYTRSTGGKIKDFWSNGDANEYTFEKFPKYIAWQLKQWMKRGLRAYDGTSIVKVLNRVATSLATKNGFWWARSSEFAYYLTHYTNLSEICSGITYTGKQDGKCLLIYDWNNIHPIAWCLHDTANDRFIYDGKSGEEDYSAIDYDSEPYSEYKGLARGPRPAKHAINRNAENAGTYWPVPGHETEFNRRYFDSLAEPERRAVYGMMNALSKLSSDSGVPSEMFAGKIEGMKRGVWKAFSSLDDRHLAMIAMGRFVVTKNDSESGAMFPTTKLALSHREYLTTDVLQDWTPHYETDYEDDDEYCTTSRAFADDGTLNLRSLLFSIYRAVDYAEGDGGEGVVPAVNLCNVVFASRILMDRYRGRMFVGESNDLLKMAIGRLRQSARDMGGRREHYPSVLLRKSIVPMMQSCVDDISELAETT